ncbi:uncharacterized protein LOC132630446 [Lycium barbarum]|uniref:uncharacterized protein LOC132630446 n=1 Tax=Lycium barbarum TaxID=112863 RepID=UPI00293F20FB|nr:uncharacterized protein LOC132630446 [Lycium barbarum]
MPEFYERLVTSRWIRFAEAPIKANYTLVREFYANAAEADITDRAIVKVRGVDVLCNASRINAYYNLQDGDNSEMAQRYEQIRQQWFVTHLHGGEQPKWLTTMQRKIDSTEFTAEAKTWLDIVTSKDQFFPLAKFAYNNNFHCSIDMAPFEALCVKGCCSPIGWFDTFEVRPWDRKVRDLEFMEREQVLLRILPMKGVMRFGKTGKLSLRYLDPFEVLRRVGEVTYELALPPGMSGVHPLFHVSMLKRYYSDGSYVVHRNLVLLGDDLTFEEGPVAILDRQVRKLRSKEIPSVKVQ